MSNCENNRQEFKMTFPFRCLKISRLKCRVVFSQTLEFILIRLGILRISYIKYFNSWNVAKWDPVLAGNGKGNRNHVIPEQSGLSALTMSWTTSLSSSLNTFDSKTHLHLFDEKIQIIKKLVRTLTTWFWLNLSGSLVSLRSLGPFSAPEFIS